MLLLPNPLISFSFFFTSSPPLSHRSHKPLIKMNHSSTLLLGILLLSASLCQATSRNNNNNKDGGDLGAGIFGPGSGFDNIPGFGKGWDKGIIGGGGGYGGGYGGPNGGYSKGGIVRNTVVCREKGPCFKKKVTCPAKCFSSYSRSGKGYGGGGGGGGCTIDCTKKCIGYC